MNDLKEQMNDSRGKKQAQINEKKKKWSGEESGRKEKIARNQEM